MEVFGLVCMYCMTAFDDLKDRQIKVRDILIFGVVGIIINLVYRPHDLMSVMGGVMIGFLVYLFSVLSKEKIGKGDALLIIVTGLYLGFTDTLVVLWVSTVLAAIVGTIYVKKRRIEIDIEMPFVPFLLVGYLLLLTVTNVGGIVACG